MQAIRRFDLFFAFLLLCATFSLAQEQPLPELGDAESAVVSLHEEEVVGEQFLIQIRRSVRTVDDPILKYFVVSNLYEIASHSDLKVSTLRPIVIDARELNAFAAPGGIIGINLGLFIFAEDVHEYSSVIAHELAHLGQRHYARRIERQRQMTVRNLLGFITSAAVISTAGTDAGLATLFGAQTVIELDELRYSRDQEIEADRIGFNALTDAGFDPLGASRMFERMQQLYRFQAKEVNEFVKTHPVTEERIADLRTQAQDFPVREFEDSLEYQLIKVRVKHRYYASDHAAMQAANTLDGDSIQDKYDLALAYVRNGEYRKAIDNMETVINAMPNSILAISALGELLVDAEQAERAVILLEDALADTPDNAPLSMIYAKALNALNRNEEATKVLAKQARLHNEDIDVWFQLAEIAGLAKNIVEVHRARAEFYALRGQYREAIQNLQSAKRLNDGKNFRIDVTLDQRILELRDLAEQADANR